MPLCIGTGRMAFELPGTEPWACRRFVAVSGSWSDPATLFATCKGQFGPNSHDVERLLGRGVEMTSDEIKKVGKATKASAGETGFIAKRRFQQSFQIAGEIAVESGREAAFKLIGTKGAEAIVRASVHRVEAEGRDIRPVIEAWDAYSSTKGGDIDSRKWASDGLDDALVGLIGHKGNRWILPAGVGLQRAALAVLIWDLADREPRFKAKYRDWLVLQCRALKLGGEYLPWLR
jgi:hypothetical protein